MINLTLGRSQCLLGMAKIALWEDLEARVTITGKYLLDQDVSDTNINQGARYHAYRTMALSDLGVTMYDHSPKESLTI